jgi:hypothetical protein
VLTSALLLLLSTTGAANSELLPALKGEYLTGRKAILPADAQGKVALLAFGFTYDSRFAVEDWVKAFRGQFGEHPQIAFYEIPMIGGMARMGKWFIDSGMRKGTPKADHERVITVYGGVDPWKKRLGFKTPDHAYLLLLDGEGRPRWRHNGKFEQSVFDELASQTRQLLGS